MIFFFGLCYKVNHNPYYMLDVLKSVYCFNVNGMYNELTTYYSAYKAI